MIRQGTVHRVTVPAPPHAHQAASRPPATAPVAANPRANHPIPMKRSLMPIRMTSTMITTMISGITKTPRIIGMNISENNAKLSLDFVRPVEYNVLVCLYAGGKTWAL